MMNSSRSFNLKSVLWGVCIGFAVMFALLMLASLIMSAAGIETGVGKVISIFILGISSLVCGVVAAKKSEVRGLVAAVAAGGLLYLLVAVISVAVTKNGFTSAFFIRLAVCVVSSAVGGAVTVFKKGKQCGGEYFFHPDASPAGVPLRRGIPAGRRAGLHPGISVVRYPYRLEEPSHGRIGAGRDQSAESQPRGPCAGLPGYGCGTGPPLGRG